MERKENQRVVITKRMLLEALLELLKKKRINEISITELCHSAGINRATFYKHYATPNDILLEISQTLAVQLMDIQSQSDDLKTVIDLSCMFIYKNADIVRVLINSNMDYTIARNSFQVLGDARLSAFFQCCGDFDETDRKLWVTFLASGCYNLTKCWLMDEMDKTPQEISALIYLMCTKGLMFN